MIRVLTERSVNDGGDFLSSVVDMVSETHFSCDTVGRELGLAIRNSLLCPEKRTEASVSESKVMCLFYYFKEFHS